MGNYLVEVSIKDEINLNIQEWIKRDLKEQLMFYRYRFFCLPSSKLVFNFYHDV